VLALFAASCGGSKSADAADAGVASIADDSADASSSDTDIQEDGGATDDPTAPTDPEDAFALFDECMADAGFDFGGSMTSIDGESSRAVISISPDGSATGADPQQEAESFEDFDFEAMDAADTGCSVHLSNLDDDFDLSPEEQAQFDDAMLEFTKCMEEQGIEIPELEGGSGIVIAGPDLGDDPQSGAPSFDDIDFEAMDAAFAECGQVFEDLEAGS
jgi:hypothetical protein